MYAIARGSPGSVLVRGMSESTWNVTRDVARVSSGKGSGPSVGRGESEM